MKKKINFQLLIITAIAIVTTLTLAMAVFYDLFKKEVLEELKVYAEVLNHTEATWEMENGHYSAQLDKLRVTLIQEDGTVVFDSNGDVQNMDNHGGRQEVVAALKNGEGEAVRKSATLNKNTFYYAIRIDNDMILRVSKEADSVWSIIKSAFPAIVGMTIVLFLLCMVVAHFLTRCLVKPIEQMANNIDHYEASSVYKELGPFLNTIKKQHQDILKNAELRQEFTANVSHELKTPLTAISGYAELIENGMGTETDILRFAGEIHHNSNRLLTLINDIIRLSELDATHIETPFETIDLYKIAAGCVRMLQVNASQHEVELSLEGSPNHIMANKEMMEELVYNLCDNAIRYNNKGGMVKVRIDKKDDKVIMTVKDTGIGIPKKYQERIFERFYRVDKSRSKLTGGTGLGLAIVKHIVVQHQAELKIESEEGKGTTIQVVFKSMADKE